MRIWKLNLFAAAVLLAASGLGSGLGGGIGPARAQSLDQEAGLWGRMHGNAIYCRVQAAHQFGVAVMDYFKRRTGGGAQYNELREKYGQTFLSQTKTPPSGAAGGNCAELRANMNAVLQQIR